MTRKRRRINWFWLILLAMLILTGAYVDRFVIPANPNPFVPTPTATREPESFISEAEALFAQGKLNQSIDAYKQAIQINPNDPSYFVALARVQVFNGQYKDAQTSAEDALLLNPNNSTAFAVRAWALDFQGDYLAAETAIKRALELDPNNAAAHAYYAEILADSYIGGTGPFDAVNQAIEESKTAQSLAPNTLETHRARGYILEVTGNYEDAIREYQAALAINNNIADLHLALGRNYYVLQVNDKAVEEFTRANTLNPTDPTPEYLISRTYGRIGEYAKAAQYAEQAVKDNPSDPALHGNLGVWLYRNFQWPEAAAELKLATVGGLTADGQQVTPLTLTNDARIAEYFYTYALVLARTYRCGEALPVSQSILAKLPGDEVSVFNANEAIRLCQANINVTPTATLVPEATITPESTGTPTAGP